MFKLQTAPCVQWQFNGLDQYVQTSNSTMRSMAVQSVQTAPCVQWQFNGLDHYVQTSNSTMRSMAVQSIQTAPCVQWQFNESIRSICSNRLQHHAFNGGSINQQQNYSPYYYIIYIYFFYYFSYNWLGYCIFFHAPALIAICRHLGKATKDWKFRDLSIMFSLCQQKLKAGWSRFRRILDWDASPWVWKLYFLV